MSGDALHRNRTVRNLVVDYALGAAILGLNPFPNLLTLTLAIAAVLLIKMIREIRSQWGFLVRPGVLTLMGNFLSFLGAMATALVAWGSLIALSFFVPEVQRLSVAAALFILFWMVGMGTNQYYINRYPIEPTAEPTVKPTVEPSDGA